MFIIPLSWCGTQRDLEPLNRCFVGLDKYESIYLSRSSTEYPLRGFVILTFLFASVLRTILRTLDGGCAEGKLFALNQGGRAPEIAKSRDKRVRSIDDDYERGTLFLEINLELSLISLNFLFSNHCYGIQDR